MTRPTVKVSTFYNPDLPLDGSQGRPLFSCGFSLDGDFDAKTLAQWRDESDKIIHAGVMAEANLLTNAVEWSQDDNRNKSWISGSCSVNSKIADREVTCEYDFAKGTKADRDEFLRLSLKEASEQVNAPRTLLDRLLDFVGQVTGDMPEIL